MRRLIFALIVWTFTGCTEYVTVTIPPPGHPVTDMTCGALGAECCGQDGGNSTLWTCDPGLYCRTHRGGGPTPCVEAQDGGTP
jgi:uncharacterized protein YceK